MGNKKTQVNVKVPLATDVGSCKASLQWFLEDQPDASAYMSHRNAMNYFVCGEEAFASIAASIQAAKKCIDIVCWGFDPAMELTRNAANAWPRGETWGSLLLGAARGEFNGGHPVQVRVLSWFDGLGSMANIGSVTPWANNNMPGFIGWGSVRQTPEQQSLLTKYLQPAQRLSASERRERREWVNHHWFGLVMNGNLPGISLRVRNGDSAAIAANLQQADPLRDGKLPAELSALEAGLVGKFGTYHQKTVLIDYDDTSADAEPVGYVMGLNCVTDYWDTRAHFHTDPKRGAGWESVIPNDEATLKPYQDYATQIRGDALVMVAKNFTDAWNDPQAKGSGQPLTRVCDLRHPPAQLTRNLPSTPHSVQIVRTEPKAKERNIERLYYQTAQSARDYIYIENQYFQYAPWVKFLKTKRIAFKAALTNCGALAKDHPELHLFVVTPTPEKGQMVPRTHDMVKELGHGSSMPNQTKKLEDELKQYDADIKSYDKAMVTFRKENHAAPGSVQPPVKPKLSSVAQTYKDSGGGSDDKVIQADLRTRLGMRSLVASMWAFDGDYVAKQRDAKRKLAPLQAKLDGMAPKAALPDADPALKSAAAQYAKKIESEQNKANAALYREIYIHSKLMVADDSMFTIGSANMNARSFYGDGEINMVSDCPKTSERLRREVWGMQTLGAEDCDGGAGLPRDISKTFRNWKDLISSNGEKKLKGNPIVGFLAPLHDERTSSLRVG
jgi:phosphatidylserine/phosphatidylglycerophosphate/cardiolipin synthase-like enzyme